MKKSLLVSTLAVAFCAIVVLAGTHKVKKIMVDNIQKSTTVKSLKSLSKAGEAADETPNLQVLLEEDFSKFTAGSEATPDATDVADATTGYIAGLKHSGLERRRRVSSRRMRIYRHRR